MPSQIFSKVVSANFFAKFQFKYFLLYMYPAGSKFKCEVSKSKSIYLHIYVYYFFTLRNFISVSNIYVILYFSLSIFKNLYA